MKTIAIIGASYLQMPLVRKAKEMGLRTVCFMWEQGAVCRDVCDKFYPISIIEKEAILQACRAERIDAIASIASDLAVPTINYVAERMGLPHNPECYTDITTNKYRMRWRFLECGVPSPRFMIAEDEACDTEGLCYPLIVKPTDRAGSQGVTKVETPEALAPAIGRARKLSFERKAIVEEFVGGREISVESISNEGRHHVLQITDKVTTEAPYFVEIAHHQPSSLPADVQRRVRGIVCHALDALHIVCGASHSELKITDDGDIRVIEIGARMGGDCIGSDLVRLSTGYDYVRGVVEVALGEFHEPQLWENQKCAGIYFLCQDTNYVLPYIQHKDEHPEIVLAEITDTELREVKCSGDRSGYFIYQSSGRFEIAGGKRLLIIGGGRGQVGLIKAAKAMGMFTIAASYKSGYPGVKIADQWCEVDITDPVAVLGAAQSLCVDGVATSCLDLGVRALGRVCDTLGLPGLSEMAANRCEDKWLMKQCLCEAGVSTSKFMKVENDEDFEEAVSRLAFPLVVKAVDFAGSKGVFIVRDREAARAAYKKVRALSRREYCVVEEFVEGTEFGAQAFVYHGEVLFVLPHGDVTFKGETQIPIGHYMPYQLDASVRDKVRSTVIEAVKALGLDNCAVNVDLILHGEDVYVIELTGRVGANCLPELVQLYYGIDYYRMIAQCAVGMDPRAEFNKRNTSPRACMARMLTASVAGKVKEVRNTNVSNADVSEITFFVERGDEVRCFTNSRDCIGQIVVSGKTLEDCRHTLDEVEAHIGVECE